jgi:hypothetical protein
MGVASFLSRRRRALAPGAAVILMHWAVLGWLSGQVRPHIPARDDEPVTVVAQLLAEAPRPAAAPSAPKPPAPAPRRARAAAPTPASPLEAASGARPQAPAATGAEAGPAGDASAGADAGQGVAQRGATDAPADVESARQTVTVGAPSAPAAPDTRSYKVDLPPAADIRFDVARLDADGTHRSGEALLSWRLDGDSYRIRVEAGIGAVFTRANLLALDSEGGIDASGFAPVTMTEKRRGRAPTATHFNRRDGTITFSATQHASPLAGGAQDKASLPLQLAAIARGDPGQLSGNLDIQVGEDRDASVYRFIVLGQEQLDTRLGRIAAWHLARPPRPGSYDARLDIWLAAGHNWYPVRIRNLEASGAVTTQTVNNIVMTNTGSRHAK